MANDNEPYVSRDDPAAYDGWEADPAEAKKYANAPTREELLAEHERGLKMLQDMRINRLGDLISPWAYSPQERAKRYAIRLQGPTTVVR